MLKLFLILGLSVYLVAGAPQPEGVEYEEEYEEEDVCLTSAESEDPEKECIFPFTFNNFTYNGCPTDPVDETKRWCSTQTDENGVHITGDGTWGYCTQGCKPEIFPDELLIGTDAENDTQTETCDFTACNGFTLKLDVFGQVETYGQCQYPAGENGADDDYFCFVNEDSACEDKVPYGDEEEGLFVTTLACKDPDAPLSRTFGFHRRSFSRGFVGSNRRYTSSSHGSSYGRGRYSSGGYRGSSFHRRSSYTPRRRYSSHRPSYSSSHVSNNLHGSSHVSNNLHGSSYGSNNNHHGSSHVNSNHHGSSYGSNNNHHGSSHVSNNHHGSSYGSNNNHHESSYGSNNNHHGSSHVSNNHHGSSYSSNNNHHGSSFGNNNHHGSSYGSNNNHHGSRHGSSNNHGSIYRGK